MRTLERNKQKVYCTTYLSSTELTDEHGNKTGEFHNVYSPLTELKVNVSPAKGKAEQSAFGLDLSYDKTIVADKNCPITEFHVLWVDIVPTLSVQNETVTPHDYVVKGVAKSQNSVTIAIEKVQVTYVPPVEEEEGEGETP